MTARTSSSPNDAAVWIPGGTFSMGSNHYYVEEAPSRWATVDGFWIDSTPVTNKAFRAFVNATGYVTRAERGSEPPYRPDVDSGSFVAGSLVFAPPSSVRQLRFFGDWWAFRPGACWWRPDGVSTLRAESDHHPVVHVTYEDAHAYAHWAGKTLPTEAEWECAARGGQTGSDFAWGDELLPNGKRMANIWLGRFPFDRQPADRGTTSPVGSFPANDYGLYDMIGNVWEWCAEPFVPARSRVNADRPCCIGSKPDVPAVSDESVHGKGVARHIIKGGSHLCAPNYCQRYRPAARQGQLVDTSTGHIGFRCIRRH